ncbi:MAG: YicC/YloC family endoribonuclease [Clostridia bacterium]
MNSMTGYGRATIERDGRQLTMELKSVNHRFLDIAFRMPRSFSFLEEDARKCLSGTLSRGHVDVFATYRNLRDDAKTVRVDQALLFAYREALGEVAAASGAQDDRTLMNLSRLPDVLVITEADEDQKALVALMQEAIEKALGEMCKMRAREGRSLEEDMRMRLDRLSGMRERIYARYPKTVSEYEARLRERIEELIGNNVDETRLLQEVAIMADRSAVSEELVRLESHIAQMREMIGLDEPVGRKLDFIVQELNREINTVSSKSQDIEITQLVVAAKAEIEKMREQVQNVE